MSTPEAHPLEPAKYYPEAASGTPLAVFGFAFSVTMLSLANTEIVPPTANLFVPVAMTTGALLMLVGGLWEFRNGNLFGATFAVSYAGFLLTTAVMLRWFAPEITKAAGAGGFGDGFGAYLIVWALFTAMLAIGAYYINVPAFLAFALLVVVYVLLGIVNIAQPTSGFLTNMAGWFGLADGVAAFYLGMGIVLNPMGSREILPMKAYPYSRPAA